MKTWWDRPSTWATQRGQIVWSREMDWIILSAHENREDFFRAAERAGVSPAAANTRIFKLLAAQDHKHWDSRLPALP